MICGYCKERNVDIEHIRNRRCDLKHARVGAGLAAPVVLEPARLPVTEEGVYLHEGFYYSVVESETGHLYAKVWASNEQWAYAPGAIRDLSADERVTAEQAKSFGDQTGRCVFCHRKLTNTEPGCSVDRGYGPVCAEREGLPWGAPDDGEITTGYPGPIGAWGASK